jgi:hypothetical protein
MNPEEIRSVDWDPDVARVSQEIASRLQARGVNVLDNDSPEDLVLLLEQLEAFEQTVEAAGGDLMVDEPPKHGKPQPDDTRFLLPVRASDESVSNYLQRLTAAMQAARTAPRPDAAG